MAADGSLSWIVAYDVRDPARLRRMGRLLSATGHRLQFSVFVCDLDPCALDRLRGAVAGIARAGEDDVRMYALTADTAGAWLGPLPSGEGVDIFGQPGLDLVRRWKSAPWGARKKNE